MTGKKRHRVLTYKEKQLNKMTRRQLLNELCYTEWTPEEVQSIIQEAKDITLTVSRSKNIARLVNEKELTELSKQPKYADFINSVWNLKKVFHRQPFEFKNLEGVAVQCYVITKIKEHISNGGYNTEKKRDDYTIEALKMWADGGENWNELIDYYNNFNDTPL